MSLVAGTRLGPYEIVSALGAGGMGEVYRAKDTNLNRAVAIKVLPAAFAQDHERVARFNREAQVLASLNHPNIAAIHGLEETDGAVALVMELVEGEDLSAHIARGAIPIAEALPIARQIAEGLEAAHEKGIVHRDLKPANIKVRADGTVKVLDFGLAKAMDPGDSSGANAMNSPTMTARATEIGMIIGTAAYMSPEQARGRAVDKRADIWAFGVVLYEMLTGTRAFDPSRASGSPRASSRGDGDSIVVTLANVIKEDPKWDALPKDLPQPLARLLRRCLDKDPKKRLRDIGEARMILVDPSALEPAFAGSPAIVPGGASRRAPWTVAAAATAIAAIAMAWSLTRTPGGGDVASRSAGVTTFALLGDSSLRESLNATYPFAVSRDGQTVVFIASNESGRRLWVRTLADPAARMLPATEDALSPAISPNGEWVAFVATGSVIRKIRIDGTGASTVASIDNNTFAIAWGSDNDIVFEMIAPATGMQHVTATGGNPELLIPLDNASGESRQRRPLVLRDQGLIFYTSTVRDAPDTISAFSLKDRRTTRLALEGTQALGVVDGHLIYSRADGFIMAAPFAMEDLRITAPPIQLSEQVVSSSPGTAVVLSESGTLVYAPASLELSRLMLGTSAGDRKPLGEWIRAFENPLFSPDGTRVAVGIVAPDGSSDLWVFDLGSSEPTRVTRGERVSPLCGWTPDGKALIYARSGGIWMAPIGSGAAPRELVKAGAMTALGFIRGVSAAPDGKSIVAIHRGTKGQTLLSRVSIADGTVEPIGEETGQSSSPGSQPRFSFDGKWVAYSDSSEVYVHSLVGGEHMQVSEAGGSLPVWSHDSRRLFYRAPAGMFAAALDLGADVKVLSRNAVTTISSTDTLVDASPDGKTLLLQVPVGQGPRVLVALNWADAVRRQLQSRKGQ